MNEVGATECRPIGAEAEVGRDDGIVVDVPNLNYKLRAKLRFKNIQ